MRAASRWSEGGDALQASLTVRGVRVARGTSSCRIPNRLAPSSDAMKLTPVILPPGRLRLATMPAPTGSVPAEKTIGMLGVAAFAARAVAVPSALTMTVTWRRARSAANSVSRPLSPCAQRNSIATLRPSVYPASPRPFRNAARALVFASGEPGWRNPISGVVGCCACAVGGSAVVAAPIIAPRNSRRLIVAPRPRQVIELA